jgi:hypothetical protein
MAIEYQWVGGDSGEYVPVEVPDPVIPVAQGIAGVLPASNPTATAVDPQSIAQSIYGRPLIDQELAALQGMSPDQVSQTLTSSLAAWNAQQQNAANTAVAQTVVDAPATPAPVTTSTQSSQDAAIDNFIRWQQQQTDPFLMQNLGEQYAKRNPGQDPLTDPEMRKFAAEQIARAEGNARVVALNQGFPASGVVYSSNDPTTGAILMARADRSTDVFFPDGTKQNVPPGDPYGVIRGYKGPTTGDYGVQIRDVGAWNAPKTAADKMALAQQIARLGYDPTGRYDPEVLALAQQVQKAGPTGATGVAALAAQQMQNATTPAPTTPPAPTKTASGVTVKDYQGNPFDTGITLNLAKQIGSAFDPKKSSGAAFTTQGQSIGFDYDQAKQMLGGKDPSAAQQVLLDISRSLQQKGVNDLSQIGVRTVDVEREYGDSGNTRTEKQREFYNKETGERIAGENESIGQTFTGKGATYYNLDVGPDGKPTFTTKAASTSDADIAAMALPLLLGPAGLNLTGLLSGALGSAGITGLAGQAIAQGLMSGATSSLFGGDFLKGALSGALGPVISGGIGAALPSGFAAENPAIAKFLTNAGTSAVQGALSGKNVDFGQMLQNAAMSGVAGAAMDKAGIPSNLAPILVSLARSGTITPQAAMQMITQMGRKG